MAIINVKCKCGKEIKVDVKTIDKLRNENTLLKKEIENLKCKISALETMRDTGKGSNFNYSDFADLFKGFQK